MNEIDIINYLRKIINNSYALNLNDDVFFDNKKSLLASMDTYNEKIHFLNFKNPDLVIKKAIRSSISDIISKGANPKYLLLSFSGPKKSFTKKNLKLMSNSIKKEQKKYGFFLIGGDTTSSLTTSFSICSLSYSKKIVKRNGYIVNDDIYLTGNIGDSSIGLSILKNKIKVDHKSKKYFVDKYYSPNLPFGFHKFLNKFASSSMDVSDGLLLDLKKLVSYNKNGFIIDYNQLPTSSYFNKIFKQRKHLINKHLFKGDDYQILFCSNKKNRKIINKYAKKMNQKITRIGIITVDSSNYLRFNNKIIKIKDYQGYIHNFA